MKKLFRILLYPFIIIFALVILTPKEEIYFLLEKEIYKNKIIISNEKITDLGVVFSLKDFQLFYDSIKAGKCENATVFFSLFYNSISMKNFIIDKDFKDFFPGNIEYIRGKQTIFLPHLIFLEGKGAFGNLTGEIDLLKRKIIITINASSIMSRKYRQLLQGFRRTQKGYVYEQNF